MMQGEPRRNVVIFCSVVCPAWLYFLGRSVVWLVESLAAL